MNPSASGCTINGNNAHGGQRCGMAICPSDASASNDWFISPPIQLGTNSSFSFWALSPKPSTWGNDEFKVLVSTTNNNPSSFTPISGSNPVQAPSTWTQFTYNLSAYDNQTIYLAIQHTSTDKFMLWIDDLVINSTSSSCTTPSITSQPQSQTVCQGSNVTFSVSASGTAPLSYQWKKNGTNISGATSPTLTLNNVSSSDAGSYTCVVSNSCGNVTSSSATLTVYPSTQITSQPTQQTVYVGQNVTFSVTASGNNLTYQWQKNGTNLTNSTHISGATSSTLQIFNVTTADVGQYRCIVTGSCGSATSNAATLDVLTGIEEDNAVPFTIYPNPSDGIFFINFGNEEFNGNLSIFDSQGKLVMWEKLENIHEKRISLNYLTAGQYILLIQTNSHVYVKHLQIK